MSNKIGLDHKKVIFKSESDYKQLLVNLRPSIKYVSLFHTLDNEDNVIAYAKENMKLVSEKKSNKFYESRYGGRKMPLYTFEFNEVFYRYLKSFEYIFINSDENVVKLNEKFTQVDIAFLDKEMNLIFWTITHEGIAYLSNSIR